MRISKSRSTIAVAGLVGALVITFIAPAVGLIVTSDRVLTALLWPLPLVGRFVPAPCYDQGPGLPLHCEGGLIQVGGIAVALALTALWYQVLLYAYLFWAALHRLRRKVG